MTIQQYIQQSILLPRMKEKGVLVVYDSAQQYREIVNVLHNETIKIVDATESSIESREDAMQTFIHMGEKDNEIEGLIIYVPTKLPKDDDEKQRDPFSVYGTCCNTFPDAISDADSFENVCLKFKADYADDVRKLFAADPNPSMEAINAIGGGSSWPMLKSMLGVESAMEALKALMAPTQEQLQSLNDNNNWMSEAKELCQSVLGLSPKTRSKKLEPLSEELWRYILFSEFVFDLPVELPASLQNMPKALDDKKTIIEGLCELLRNDIRTQDTYIEHADRIEKELKLPIHCADIENLGIRDTFSFEERSFIKLVIKKLEADDSDGVREILKRHSQSVWTKKDEVQAQWNVVSKSLTLIEKSVQYGEQYKARCKTLESLISFYTESLRELDKLHREFEQSSNDAWSEHETLDVLLSIARKRFKHVMESVHHLFINYVVSEGWPPSCGISNTRVFDEFVSPLLKESGNRVAYLMVDALRYELGLELVKELQEYGKVDVKTAFSVLPSITEIGMASLLPDAAHKLSIVKKDDSFITAYEGKPVKSVSQRMKILRDRYGTRFAHMTLADFVKPRTKISESTELFVLRSVEIDHFFENTPESAPSQMKEIIRKIKHSILKLQENGFTEVIIVTDHGFVMNTASEAGDVCSKPSGDWINTHERAMLGKGVEDGHNAVVSCEKMSIAGDFESFATPKALVPYRSGLSFFHGGLSLQECIVPVILLQVAQIKKSAGGQVEVSLSYKGGKKRINSRILVLDISAQAEDLFAVEPSEILIEARDKDKNVIGEMRISEVINPATGTFMLESGSENNLRITLKMLEDFEGKFTVVAINPATDELYAKLELETDYMV